MPFISIENNSFKVIELLNFIIKKLESNSKLIKENYCWYSLLDEPKIMQMKQNLILSKGQTESIPILECMHNDMIVCVCVNEFILIDIGDEISVVKKFNTPQQVWEEVIKPDIEFELGVKIVD